MDYIISSGNSCRGIILENRDSMTILEGGTTLETTVSSGGKIIASWGGLMDNTIVNSSGRMVVFSGGTANRTVIGGYDAMFIVYSGGTATNITATSGARLCFTVAPRTFIQGTLDGNAFEIQGGVISSYTVNHGGELHVLSDCRASNTMLQYGCLFISSGGIANNTTVLEITVTAMPVAVYLSILMA